MTVVAKGFILAGVRGPGYTSDHCYHSQQKSFLAAKIFFYVSNKEALLSLALVC